MKNVCYTCLSNSGELRISPGKTIYEGEHWVIEHAYPSGLIGWLVIVLRRHAEALHELNDDELNELGILQKRTVKLLHSVLKCEKEYIMCFAETPGFKHIHFHVVPKPKDLSPESIGTNIFTMLKVNQTQSIPREKIANFCEKMNKLFTQSA